LHLFGLPDDEAERVRYAVSIPHMGSLLNLHDGHAPMPGLDSLPPADRPSSMILFWSFRIMVGLGFLMALLGACSLLARLRGRLTLALAAPAPCDGSMGFVAVICLGDDRGRPAAQVIGCSPRARCRRSPRRGGRLAGRPSSSIAVFAAGIFILRLMVRPGGGDRSVPSAGIVAAAASARRRGGGS
jgi:cytochrome d ubiquinol oxidase subunit I